MAPRANWKSFLRLSLVTCPIALFPATSVSEKISFNQINKKTGNRIRYLKVDADTGDEVASEDIIKGYKVDTDRYLEVTKDELENIALESTRTIEIDEFVPRSEIDDLYLVRPYLARHIVDQKSGHFEPGKFEDHYEAALSELLATKQKGVPITAAKKAAPDNVVNLMDALRASIGQKSKPASSSAKRAKAPAKKAASRKNLLEKIVRPAPLGPCSSSLRSASLSLGLR